MGKIKITHLHFYNKRFSNIIDRNPLENVFYEVCNPSPDSYVNMSLFCMKDILDIKLIRKENTRACVYDLSVDTVHSYYANGILVSNSYLENGTSTIEPRPWLVPALNANREKIMQDFKGTIDPTINEPEEPEEV